MGLGDGEDTVNLGHRDLLYGAIGPVDFEVVDLRGGAEAEVETRIGAGGVAAAANDVGALAVAIDGQEGLGADGVSGGVVDSSRWIRRSGRARGSGRWIY